MGARSMSMADPSTAQIADQNPGSWKLASDIEGDVQGLIISAFSSLPFAKALFLEAQTGGGAWLKSLREVVTITPSDGPQQPAAVLAFTATGLATLGLDAAALATFPLPFQEGMLQQDRRRRLGDLPEFGIAAAQLAWSANTPEQLHDPSGRTPATVHALLVLYDQTHEALEALAKSVGDKLSPHDVAIVRSMPLDLRLDEAQIAREHFGFADGISQPIPYGPGTRGRDGAAYPQDPLHGVPLGEVLLGYSNAHGEIPPGPMVVTAQEVPLPVTADQGAVERLQKMEKAAALRDLGLNGSYLVVRELKQDVAGFWNSLEKAAQSLNERAGPQAQPVTADWLAARIVGREPDGDLVCPSGALPAKDGQPDNDALFYKDDQFGFGCPMGSHVRRANPRDSLASDAANCPDLLKAANNHRLLRRGRKFGPSIENPLVDDGIDRGLLFMCLNTDIERQFEFVQQNWLFNPNFATLYKETDPLIGPKGQMTLPHEPLRRIFDVETYVTFVGGDYFFLPSLSALSYFETLIAPRMHVADEGLS